MFFLISLNHQIRNYFKFWGPKNSHINRGPEVNVFFNTLQARLWPGSNFVYNDIKPKQYNHISARRFQIAYINLNLFLIKENLRRALSPLLPMTIESSLRSSTASTSASLASPQYNFVTTCTYFHFYHNQTTY